VTNTPSAWTEADIARESKKAQYERERYSDLFHKVVRHGENQQIPGALPHRTVVPQQPLRLRETQERTMKAPSD
jgi:hypothetical protein